MKAHNFINLSDQTFGKLTVVRQVDTGKWDCLCECGNMKQVRGTHLRNGDTNSCGCIVKKHGMNNSPEAQTLRNMKYRCNNKNSPNFHLYGGRGIAVCDRWSGDDGLTNFIADMGERPSSKHSIDRIDNNGNYEPDNCRWATLLEQQNNRRSNVILEYEGERKTLIEWARLSSVSVAAFKNRIRRGWTIERAMEQH